MPEPDTICGYSLSDVRASLRTSIDRRDRRAAHRWTAELVATPGAVGSLWSSYWMAWAVAQGAGSASPTVPILLKQGWAEIADKAHAHGCWIAFRNDHEVRSTAADMTIRLLEQTRQTPVVWPSKELILYDVGAMRDSSPPAAADGPAVLAVWQRNEDAMELRMMAGRWLTFLEAGDLRSALSAVAWTLLSPVQQGLLQPLKVAARGAATLPAKARSSPLWFWLEVGRHWLLQRTSLHRGWHTMHVAIAEAFQQNYKRWTAVDRMRILLAWILQLRASLVPQPADLWTAPPVHIHGADIDLPYKEVAAELADPNVAIQKPAAPAAVAKTAAIDEKKVAMSKAEAKMAEADAAVYAALGITAEDV